MRWELRRAEGLTPDEQLALRALSLAVYPPEVAAAWPGRAVEWAASPWAVLCWGGDGAARCHVGALLREARWDDRAVRVGGVGGVKTHPGFRCQGLATAGIGRALDFFREQGADFGLLVCEPGLVPFYERLGWHPFTGELLVTQRQATVAFTLNGPMTFPLRLRPTRGRIDLLGPPW